MMDGRVSEIVIFNLLFIYCRLFCFLQLWTTLLEKFMPYIFVILASLCMLSFTSILRATTFTGPTELSSQEFKDLTINGPSKLNEIKADSLTVNGPLYFNHLKIKGDTKISGPSSGEDAEFENITIHGTFWGSKIKMNNLQADGEITIEDFKINGNVNINAVLNAKNGSFNDINSVQAPVALYNVTVNNIYVKKGSMDVGESKTTPESKTNSNTSNSNGKNNVVKLAGNTQVSGNITFESGDGVVFIRDKTAELKGKVIGGKIKKWDEF